MHRTNVSFEGQPNCGADSTRIARRAFQSHTQTGPAFDVLKQTRGGAILSDHQIDSAIFVKVTRGRAALLTVEHDSGEMPGHGFESAAAKPAQPKPATRIQAREFRSQREKILAQEDVLLAVAIEIRHRDRKHRRPLRLGGQRHGLEAIPAIEKDHRS
jgi:hypothetical protein